MSDAKSAVYAMVTAASELDVPEEVASRLRQLAKESWSGVAGPGDKYERTSRGISPIGEIVRFIASVLEAAGAGPL